jgi:hypothetical protein
MSQSRFAINAVLCRSGLHLVARETVVEGAGRVNNVNNTGKSS